jgi:hypothetical protein
MFEKIAEQRIRDAMARGEFDDLPGKGEPIDLTEYFNAPEEVRAGYALLKQNNVAPYEVELLREIGETREARDACESAERRAKLTALLNAKLLELSLLRDRARQKRGQRLP